jgi:hypothetical protein
MDSVSLDELLARIKTELTKLGPILDLEVVRDPQGSTTEGAVTAGSRTVEHSWRSGLEARRTRWTPLPATLGAPTRPGQEKMLSDVPRVILASRWMVRGEGWVRWASPCAYVAGWRGAGDSPLYCGHGHAT